MVDIRQHQAYSQHLVDDITHSFLEAGILLDRMTLANIAKNTKMVAESITETYSQFVNFYNWLQREAARRDSKDKKVMEILSYLQKIAKNLLLLRQEVIALIPNLKKKEMEVPGERKRIEDEKNFQAAKKALKNKYTELDYLLEKEQLSGYLKEVEESLFVSESLLPYLRELSGAIKYHIKDNFAQVRQEDLLAEIDIYLTELAKLSKTIAARNSLLPNLLGEIQIWKNVYKNIKKMNAQNYYPMKTQLFKLIKDDEQIYRSIEAA